MRSKFKWIFTLLVALSMQFSFAQEKTVSGVASDNKGPIAGVNIKIKGAATKVQSDFDGKYSIKAKAGDVLLFTFTGMKDQSRVVGASNTINIVMLGEVSLLEDVVVIGYNRTRTKASNSTASATISAEVIQNRPNATFVNSLQGTVAGVSVTSSSGSPGSGQVQANIRGVGTISASAQPLYVIDGAPSTGNQFRSINQNDIETVTVLKDAGAGSIYGNRAANGVIVITTKQAKFGSGLKITYDTTTGFNRLPKNRYNMSSTQEILQLERIRNIGVGGTGGRNPDGTARALTDAEITGFGVQTNWIEEFFGIDITQQHNLNVGFGGDKISNNASFGFFTQGGQVPGTDFTRFTFRNNFNGKSNDGKFNLAANVAFAYSKRNQLDQEINTGINSNTIQNPLYGSLFGLPYAKPGIYQTGQDLFNAIGQNFVGPNDTYVLEDIIRNRSLPSWFVETSAIANIFASYKIADNLTFSNRAAIDWKSNRRVFARDPKSYLAIVVASSRAEEFGGSQTISTDNDFTFINTANLSYSKKISKHNFGADLFMEYSKSHYLFATGFQNGLNPKTYVPGAGAGFVAFNPATPNSYISTTGANKIDAGTLSYFATADYDYDSIFGVSGTFRRDGTYRFVGDNKWGNFWSVSGRWNIDKMSFMEGGIFSLLKLRGSYGTLGNQNISAGANGFSEIFLAAGITRDINAVGNSYNNAPGGIFQGIGNPLIRWEQTSQANIGLDAILLKDKLEVNLDVYRKETTDLFNPTDISAISSLYSINGNNGTLRNDGIEVSLKYNFVNKKDLLFSVFANTAYNKSKIIANTNLAQQGNSIVTLPGQLFNEWNLIPYVGVNQTNGNLLFLDANNNPTENPDLIKDRRLNGKNRLPVFVGGFGTNFEYKGFFANVLFSYAQGNYRWDNTLLYLYDPNNIGDDNVSSDLLNAWTPSNPSNFPALGAGNISVADNSDRYLIDSSFLRLRNVSVGYNVPRDFLKRTFIRSLRVFAQGENLVTWTKWRGFDPEGTTSFSLPTYPNPIVLSIGTSIQF